MLEQIALLAAGVVAPFLINLFKGDMSGKPAFALSVMTSVALALGIKVVFPAWLGGIPEALTPDEALGAMGQVFAIATIVYKTILEKYQKGE